MDLRGINDAPMREVPPWDISYALDGCTADPHDDDRVLRLKKKDLLYLFDSWSMIIHGSLLMSTG